ncbi:MAG: hypothetical protein JXR67_10350 [Bacteroidales bacterium]|nr:hypothetical protein [Bacteroidales bacterium]
MPRKRRVWLLLLFIIFRIAFQVPAEASSHSFPGNQESRSRDSIEKQILFNGKIWINLYQITEGHQFFSSRDFLKGSVSMSGKTFADPVLRFKLDLVNDELLLSADNSTVIQLNKEMVDFFTLESEGRTFLFVKLEADSVNPLNGYYHDLHSGPTKLYVSYSKELRLRSTVGERDTFIQSHSVHLVRDGVAYRITGRASLLKLLADRKIQVRKFIRAEKIRISRNNPGSIVPLLEFYDSLE